MHPATADLRVQHAFAAAARPGWQLISFTRLRAARESKGVRRVHTSLAGSRQLQSRSAFNPMTSKILTGGFDDCVSDIA